MKDIRIDLVKCTSHYSKEKHRIKDGRYEGEVPQLYRVDINGIIKYCKSMAGAEKYLHNLGYRYNSDYSGFNKTHRSDAEIEDEINYKKIA